MCVVILTIEAFQHADYTALAPAEKVRRAGAGGRPNLRGSSRTSDAPAAWWTPFSRGARLAERRPSARGATLDLARLGAPGLVVGGDYTKAWVPDPGLGMSRLDQHESDVTLAYAFSGRLRGLAAKLRWATVRSALGAGSLNGREYRDLRFGLSYAGSVRRGAR